MESPPFGQWLKDRRKMLDLTQEQLAERLGCSSETLRKIETERQRPSRQIAERLAGILGIPVEQHGSFVQAARSVDVAVANERKHVDRYQPVEPVQRNVVALPAPATPLIGRAREVATVASLLERSDIRILTLVGPPGIGKTRLALQLAADVSDRFVDGCYFVGLAPLQEPELVIPTIAQTLGIKEVAGRSPEMRVQDFLANKQVLLVLDNFEHVLEAGASIADLLRSAPGIKILTTSRTPLNIYGEQEYLVPPLTLPDIKEDGDSLMDYEAPRLFMARAQAIQPGFTPTAHQARVIAEICARLDGLPLAIELAAARIKLFGPDGLLRRLQQPLAVLTDGARDLPARQRTLRHAISWSYELLAPAEQRLFRQLSVFVGGWNVEAATAVCGAGEDEPIVLDSLKKLLDSSLLRHGIGPDGEARFGMLETIREYAHEQLITSAELDALRSKHAHYFQQMSEIAAEGLNGPQQVQWLDRLGVEHDNVRAALTWALEKDDVELALHVAAPLWLFWLMRGHAAEGGQWLGRVVTASAGATVERAQALNGAGWIALFRGNYSDAEAHVEQSLSLFRELDDTEGIAAALANLGFVAMLGQRGLERVPAILQEVSSLQAAVRDKRTRANIFILQGLAAGAAQDWTASLVLHEQSLELYEQIHDDQGIGMCLINISLLAMISGDIDKARVVMRQNLRRSAAVDDKMPLQYGLFGLGSVAAREQRFERAATLWGAAEAIRDTFGLQLTTMAISLTNYEADLAHTQSILGQETFHAVWNAGRTMPSIALLDYALEEKGVAS